MTDIELVISANGCTDNTAQYLQYLYTAIPNLLVTWNEKPLGFAAATNEGIKLASSDKIVLLNNDTILLEQPKNQWLELLDQSDVSYVLGQNSPITQRRFGIFFCAMIQKKVFDTIGLLNEEYGIGGCEDIEFCYLAEKAGFTLAECSNNGTYPIYHKAEGTMHDPALVQDWKAKFHANELKLAKKYNTEYYKYLLSNNFERAVFLKDDRVFPRETTRYEWAAKNLLDGSIFEIGCTTGYGTQFFANHAYVGVDYDPIIINVANEQRWGDAYQFLYADINTFDLDYYDNIVAFEVIEHLDNGMEIAQKLKAHCNRLLLTVPWNEPKGFWGEHHKLHGLNESHFPGFEFTYINHAGEISDIPQPINNHNISNLMICKWTKSSAQ